MAEQRVLVAFATKHGSTREVAEAVAAALGEHGCSTEVREAGEVDDLTAFDGVVLGAALYTGRVHAHARRFLERHRAALQALPFAVFAMGPQDLEPEHVAQSRAQLERALARTPELQPLSIAIFGGVIAPETLRFPLNRMHALDARDWDAIRGWTEELARAFAGRVAAHG